MLILTLDDHSFEFKTPHELEIAMLESESPSMESCS